MCVCGSLRLGGGLKVIEPRGPEALFLENLHSKRGGRGHHKEAKERAFTGHPIVPLVTQRCSVGQGPLQPSGEEQQWDRGGTRQELCHHRVCLGLQRAGRPGDNKAT